MTVIWIVFIISVLIFLALDLGVFNKNSHVISSKEAGIWTSIWVVLSLLFSGIIYWLYKFHPEFNSEISPSNAAIRYLAGYLTELSLSIDNIFVIALVFSSLKIETKFQHRVLFWGIIGAIVLRGLMIFFGIFIIQKFHWAIYIFGIFLIFTAYKLLTNNTKEELLLENMLVYRILKRIIPVSSKTDGEKFFIKTKNGIAATPIFIALIVIEFCDVIFALDSVPAIIGITQDPFLVFSSNIFAILGLRSIYFLLSNLLLKFEYLDYSLIAILTFVGIKMLLHDIIQFQEWISLSFIAFSLFAGILFSLKYSKK